MKKSFSITAFFVLTALCLLTVTTFCSKMGLKNELTKYYQSEWSRLSDNFTTAHFKALILEYMDTMENCPYPVATERNAIAHKLAEEYCEQELYNNLADIALPYIEKHLSVVELKEINSTVKEETLLASIIQISAIMKNEFPGIIDTHTGTAIARIMNNEEPPIPLLPENIPVQYMQSVEKFYEASGRRNIIENSFEAMNEMLRTGAPESQTLAENFFAHISRATPVIMSILMYDKVSKQEVDALIGIYERPEFTKLKNANIEFSEGIANADSKISELFEKWLRKQL
ncbi:MAG: hypothetical protein IKV23_03835 [Bacteroidaceae bacterium]|nr:hypothetical protein [Bacteroidaceae bacterium]